MRYLFFVLLILDVAWWSLSAFSVLRWERWFFLELIPAFDIVAVIAHFMLLIVLVVIDKRIGVLLLVSLLWMGLLANRHLATNGSEEVVEHSASLRLMTLNVQQFGHRDEEYLELARWVKEADIDVLCLQEFGLMSEWPETRLAAERFAAASGLRNADFDPFPGSVYGTAIFSRYPIQIDSVIQGSEPSINQVKAHRLYWRKQWITIVNGHLESYNFEKKTPNDSVIQVRIKQAKAMISYAQSSAHPLLICGDMNTVPGSKNYELLAHGRQDVQKVAGLGMMATYRHFPVRIDYVFCPLDWQVRSVHLETPISSDHFGILCEFWLP